MTYHPRGRKPSPIGRIERPQREVYFIQGELTGLIKIGYGESAERRLQIIQGNSPDRLNLIGRILTDDASGLEERLHMRFSRCRAHGEWHSPAPELLAYIAEHGQSYAEAMEAEVRAAIECRPREPRPKLRAV